MKKNNSFLLKPLSLFILVFLTQTNLAYSTTVEKGIHRGKVEETFSCEINVIKSGRCTKENTTQHKYRDMVRSTEKLFAKQATKPYSGNQDSKDIGGDWNCHNYIVKKLPEYIPGCPAGLDNSYKRYPDNQKEMEVLMRWVGLYKTIPFQQRNYQENYLSNTQNKFRIPVGCEWTGKQNSYLYNQNYYNLGYDKYYMHMSTANKHQILKVDLARDYTGNSRGCYPKCEIIEEAIEKNNSFEELGTYQCARGTGTYTKRAKYVYKLPSSIYQRAGRENGYYIKPEECANQSPVLQRHAGVYDINNCKESSNEKVQVYYYSDFFHYSDKGLKHFKEKTGITSSKNNTERVMRVVFTGKVSSNILSKKILDPNNGSLKAVYESLFNPENVQDITEFKVVLKKEGYDNIINKNPPTQKLLSKEIHKFYDDAIEECIRNPNVTCNASNSVVLKALRNYDNNVAMGIFFQHMNDVGNKTGGNFSLKKIEKLNSYILKITDAFIFQNELRAKNCELLIENLNKDYYKDQDKGRGTIQCGDKNEQPLFNINEFAYNNYYWNNRVTEIDITNLVKSGKIPYLYFINNDDSAVREFNVHFIISYKQNEATKEIPTGYNWN